MAWVEECFTEYTDSVDGRVYVVTENETAGTAARTLGTALAADSAVTPTCNQRVLVRADVTVKHPFEPGKSQYKHTYKVLDFTEWLKRNPGKAILLPDVDMRKDPLASVAGLPVSGSIAISVPPVQVYHMQHMAGQPFDPMPHHTRTFLWYATSNDEIDNPSTGLGAKGGCRGITAGTYTMGYVLDHAEARPVPWPTPLWECKAVFFLENYVNVQSTQTVDATRVELDETGGNARICRFDKPSGDGINYDQWTGKEFNFSTIVDAKLTGSWG